MAYDVSSAYLEAIAQQTRTTKVTGTIITQKGVTLELTNEKVGAGSLYITNQCVSGDSFQYGSVFSAEAGITLKTEVDRYSLYEAEMVLVFHIMLPSGEYEEVPLGTFYINEANRVGTNISIKAYDAMLKFDTSILESTTGYAFDLLTIAADKCGVVLAQTLSEIEALPNGNILLSLASDRINTYRDLVSMVAMITCTYAIIDRTGKLRLVPFTGVSVRTIDHKIRTSSSFSDFQTYFATVSADFVRDNAYVTYVANDSESDGLLYDMGEIPIVQGLDETNQAVIDLIFENLKQIRYTPLDITFSGDPSIDLGDTITCYDRDGNEFQTIVTFYKWSYRGSEQLKGAGSNPKLADAKERSSKILAGLETQIEAKTVAVYTYTNSRDIKVQGGTDIQTMKEVVRIAFTINQDCTSLFISTVHFTMDCDGYVELVPFLDGIEQSDGIIRQYCLAGDNVLTFMNYIACVKGMTYRYSVMAKTYAEETKMRVLDAQVATLTNAIVAIAKTPDEILCFDPSQWELGTMSSGQNQASTTRVRNTYYIPIEGGMVLDCSASSYSYYIEGDFYTESLTYISNILSDWTSEAVEITVPSNARYVRFRFKKSNDATITLDELKDIKWSVKPQPLYDVVAPIETVPTMLVEKYHAKAAVFGQGLAGTAKWDGTIEISEWADKIIINEVESNFVVKPFDDTVSFMKPEQEAGTVTQAIGKILLTESTEQLVIKTMTDTLSVTPITAASETEDITEE